MEKGSIVAPPLRSVAEIALGPPARYSPPMRWKSTRNHAKDETAQLSHSPTARAAKEAGRRAGRQEDSHL